MCLLQVYTIVEDIIRDRRLGEVGCIISIDAAILPSPCYRRQLISHSSCLSCIGDQAYSSIHPSIYPLSLYPSVIYLYTYHPSIYVCMYVCMYHIYHIYLSYIPYLPYLSIYLSIYPIYSSHPSIGQSAASRY